MIHPLIPGLIAMLSVAIAPQSLPGQVSGDNGPDIDFVERFALAEDRESTLSELVPGTDEYYFYHCLHYQNTERLDEAQRILETWQKRNGNHPQIQQMRHRQALLAYTNEPQVTLDYLIDKLNVNLNHQRQRPSAEPGLPSQLDPALISFQRLNERALGNDNLERYEDLGLPVAATQDLNERQLRALLQRLNHPVIPGLPQLVDQELKNPDASPFGSLPIHQLLLLDQLDELVRLRPRLRNENAFVNVYLSRLAPDNDVVWRVDREAHLAYLERLWAFASTLNASHNSLKASVLFRRLEFDLTQGEYDQARFIEYLKLPRPVPYARESVIKSVPSRDQLVNLGADFRGQTQLLPIGDDEKLVRHFLHHFLVEAPDYDEFRPWVDDRYLKERLAEAKITAGIGDTEQWASLLSPAQYRELMKRVDLEFAYTNPLQVGVDEPVEIKLTTKNIKNLIIKVFEINTGNYYRYHDGEIDTDINLDGLVPNWQKTLDYDDSRALRIERSFRFDEIDHRGVFIIDFIGSGKSSRVLIRKGGLSHVVETTAAGQVFSVFNENREFLPQATLWLAGREYPADDQGRILVPFSNQPRRETVVLTHEGLSVRAQFDHLAESYDLQAGIYVDRESLLRMGQADVIVRPQLQVAGQPTPLQLLEKVRLLVRATDLDGVETTREFQGLKLGEEYDTTVQIMVPNRLKSIQFDLLGTIQNVSRGEPQVVNASQTYTVNQIDLTETLQAVHLRANENGYCLAVRGKTGESRAAQAVLVKLKHRLFRDTVTANLQSNEAGQIPLGLLEGIDWIQVALNGAHPISWNLADSNQSTPVNWNVASQTVIKMPCDSNLDRDALALLELRGNQYFRDRSELCSVADGHIHIAGLAAGDYQLLNLRDASRKQIRVTDGPQVGPWLMGKHRTLEVRNPDPLFVKDLQVAADKVRVELGGDTRFSRVHVIATRYQPRFDVFAELSRAGDLEPLMIREAIALNGYMAGRSIGEEYQYILERQLQQKFPGNMLTRPSLLLNPWALRTTENDLQVAATGEAFGRGGQGSQADASRQQSQGQQTVANSDFVNLDFLAAGSIALTNLAVGQDGSVTLDRQLFGEKHMLQIVVENPRQTLFRQVVLPEFALEYRDLRLVDGLDPENHFSQQKRYSVLKKDEVFELNDISSAKFQQYDSLADIYRFYVTLTGNEQLEEFGFLMDWPQKSAAEKLELYKQHACHELHFFLMKKDPQAFQEVILPYLENKLHKTFLDQYLLDLDLQSWVQPWDFQRLNTVEQILLGRRLDDHRQRLDQLIGDDYDNHPTSRREFDRFYDFAVLGNALDTDEKSVAMNERMNQTRGVLQERARQADENPSEDAEAGQALAAALPAPANAAPGRRGRQRPNAAGMEEGKKGDASLRDKIAIVDADSFSKEKMESRDGGESQFGLGGGGGRYFANDDLAESRKELQQYYQRIKPTQEWVESNYYRLPIEQQDRELIRINRFWRDLALHQGDGAFLSPYFPESCRNFTEMMLALSVLDLPFEDPEHEVVYEDDSMRLTPRSDLIAFFEQVRPSTFDRGETTVLISENFYRNDDRYRTVEGRQSENFVRKEFLPHVLYGGQIVITNPTSAPQEIDLLIQIPQGALPVMGSHETRTRQLDMAAFSTETLEYYFYFPTPGDFEHYPAHVSIDSLTVAAAEGMSFHVVEQLSEVDTSSWAYISQNGTEQQVLDFLGSQNLQSHDLGLIAFRMHDARFFGQTMDLLQKRFAFNETLWAYGLKHADAQAIGQFLQNRDGFVHECGSWLESPLLTIRPVIRNLYQHREYWPLINARAHRLGSKRKILNDAIWQQYHLLLDIIARQNRPRNETHLAVTYYMLLQDRVADAIHHFEKVDPKRMETRLQYDYCAAYLAMSRGQPDQAREIAQAYLDYPVQRWQELFAAVSAQVAEIQGGETVVVDERDPTQRQTEAASQTPSFDFVVESLKTKINYQNLNQVTVNYYQMDVELLFSRNPFVQRQDDSFALIQPNATETVDLPVNQNVLEIDLPETFRTSNVLVEVVGGGKIERQAYYANSMNVQTIEPFGQIKVTQAAGDARLSGVYVKVYTRKADQTVHFYKDGYTDLRGRFDYASLSNQDLNDVEKFAILIISPEFGAVVKEADVPQE